MNITKALVVGGIGAGIIYGYAWYRGVYRLEYGLVGLGVQGTQWHVEIGVYNPTGFTYAVPGISFQAYDKNGAFLGLIYQSNIQIIRPGTNKLDAFLAPALAGIINTIVSAAIPGQPLELMLKGNLQVGNQNIYLEIPITQKLSA